MRRKWYFIVPAAIFGMVLFIALGGGVVRLLWNWLLPPIFGFHLITFWQAIGLLALSRILFGGYGLFGGGRSRGRRRMAERWEQMTPEERERFRDGMRTRCGFGPPPSAETAD
jgi:hypothetical protein